MTNFFSKMYGVKKDSPNAPVTTTPVAPSIIAPAAKRLRGLKLTNSHMHEIDLNGETVTIPSAAYVKLLEDQIRDMKKENREIRNDLEQLRRASRQLVSRVNSHDAKLANSIVVGKR